MSTLVPCANPAACGVKHGHRPGTICRFNAPSAQRSTPTLKSASSQSANQDLIDSLNTKGWPRPRLEAVVDGERGMWPMPWVSKLEMVDGQPTPLLGEIDTDRYEEIIEKWLCQVCGDECGQTAYAPVSPHVADNSGRMFIYNGPVCSMRCARLVLAMCPHFEDVTDVVSFDRDDSAASPYQEILDIDQYVYVTEESPEQHAAALDQHQRDLLADWMSDVSGSWRSRQDRSVHQLHEQLQQGSAQDRMENWAHSYGEAKADITERIESVLSRFETLPQDWRSRFDLR